MSVFLADLQHFDEGKTGPLPSVVAVRLIDRGYPSIVASRVALTPRVTIGCPRGGDSRPGRDLAEALDRKLPDVVDALLYWERWAP